MASASEVCWSDAALAVCRLVEETKGHKTLKYLGPSCLVHFSDTSTPKILSSTSSGKTSISERASSYFLVASAEVLKKNQIEACENNSGRSVKIVAEFVRVRDGRKLERKTLSPIKVGGELCRALDDIVESDGMIFIALTGLRRSIFNKSNLLSRALEVAEIQGGNSSARMTSNANDLRCVLFTLVTCGKKAFQLQDNPEFGTKVFDLLPFDTVLTCENQTRSSRYFLQNDEKKRFLNEDEFPKNDIPFGAIILKNVMFAGVLNFDSRQPSPVFVESSLQTDEKAAPIENSCRSLDKSLDSNRVVYVPINLQSADNENQPAGECSAPELSPETGTGGSEEEVQGGPADEQVQGSEEEGGERVTIQKKEEKSVSQGYREPLTAMVPRVTGIQRNPAEIPLAPAVSGGPEYSLPPSPQRCLETQGASTDLNSHGSGFLFQNGRYNELPEGAQGEGWEQSLSGSRHPKKEEHPEVKPSISISTGTKKTYKLADLLKETLLSCLELLEALCRSLDKEYKYGLCKYWKHLAEYFHISEQEYQRFEFQPVFSPTELLFEYLQTADPDVTIGCLKVGLRKIERLDVIDLLVQHEKCDPLALNDETLVSSLFDTDPDIIGELAYLLDIQKSGVKKWSDLAPKLNIPRRIFRMFENCTAGNPTEKVFEIVKVQSPKLTIGELINHLKALKRHDVIKAIKKSTKVTEISVIKELVADVEVMEEVCDLLNQINRTTTVSGLRNLGNRLKIKKEILDDLLPSMEVNQSPTEALIRRLGGSNPSLTLVDFIWALHEISRPDVIVLLDEYLPAGCVQRLLISSCNCEICQQVLPRQSGGS
ncbi:uncharacterized protein LOC113671684 isoform X1 [Pocillopora damicornis]|uniref:uncharacterized protein LOC113671684 isoform X1 n=1 Tax=Pocillopora damicornis TaxID=46731 RepID=UPI000F556FA4|nr:uncharacterized protein LOC113671684 isoform X1 [Pocillopora damicornis]